MAEMTDEKKIITEAPGKKFLSKKVIKIVIIVVIVAIVLYFGKKLIK